MNWTCWRTSRHLFAYCPSRRELVLPMWPPPGIWILCGAHASSFIVLRSRTCYTCLFSFCFLKLVYFLFGSSQSNQFGLFSWWTMDSRLLSKRLENLSRSGSTTGIRLSLGDMHIPPQRRDDSWQVRPERAKSDTKRQATVYWMRCSMLSAAVACICVHGYVAVF